jgi:hypothetical protein
MKTMNRKSHKLQSTIALLVGGMLLAPGAFAEESDSVIDALKEGTIIFDARFRYENVDDQAVERHGKANTLRTRFGYETGTFNGFSALIEGSNTVNIGNERYNDTLNGRINRGVVADPEGTAVNRAFIRYSGIEDTTITAGRQTLILDNERFVSNTNFRQKQTTHDAVNFTTSFIPHVTVNYSYGWGFNTVTSADQDAGDFDVSNNLFNISTDIVPYTKVSGYAYLLDFDDAVENSLDTYGIHFDGAIPVNDDFSVVYQGDYAHQDEGDGNEADIDFDYFLIESGFSWAGVTVKGGFQSLEGDGTNSFQTPLGDAHPYAGWADVFVATPVDGLEDYYGKVSYLHKINNVDYLESVNFVAEYHTFESENGSTDYGDEWDLGIYTKINQYYTVGFEYAKFSADNESTFEDVDRFWLTLNVAL